MKKVCLTPWLLLCSTVIILSVVAAVVADMPSTNMLVNPGFEEGTDMPDHWKIDTSKIPLFSRDTTVARSGKASLKWENSDPGNYQLLGQAVDLLPGRMYELSAWIKTENLYGARESGAAICMGLQDTKQQYAKGGPHPGGQKGTADWWQLMAYCGPITQEHPKGTFTCYVRKNERANQTFTGTAWWDDVSFRPVSFYTRLLKPAYKRMIFDNQTAVELELESYPSDYNMAFSDVQAVIDVLDAAGSRVQHAAFDIYTKQQNVTLDLASLEPGRYTLVTKMIRRQDGHELWQWRYAVQRMSSNASRSKVWIDSQGRTYIDGKPFFPLGVYAQEVPMELLANSPFNCYMSYRPQSNEQMDQAHAAGLKVIYSVKDYFNKIWYSPTKIKSVHDEIPELLQTIRTFRDHPALLAWYTNDELGPDTLPQHWAHYETIAEEDPDHPAWNLHNKPHEMNILMNACDIMGIDSYPIPPKAPLSDVANDTKATLVGVRNSRPVWVVPTLSNPAAWGEKDGRPPTLEEMRCSSWLAICSGAKGLVYYALHMVQRDTDPAYPFEQRWSEIKQMASEIEQRIDMLLGDSESPQISVHAPNWLHWTARSIADTVFLIAVCDGDGQGEVQFHIDTKPKKIIREVIGQQASSTLQAKETWIDTFNKNEVKIYTISLVK